MSENVQPQKRGAVDLRKMLVRGSAYVGVAIPMALPEDVKKVFFKLAPPKFLPSNIHIFRGVRCMISISLYPESNRVHVSLHSDDDQLARDDKEYEERASEAAEAVVDGLLECFDTYIDVLKNLRNAEALEKVLKQFIERKNLLEVREIRH
jgi:hypothetical protein